MLTGRHTQNGYVCDDIDAAIALFRERGLDRDPMVIPVEQTVMTPAGPKRQKSRITMFWLNGLQYELIEPELDEAGVYANSAGKEGPIRFHHICMKVENWDDFRSRVSQQDFPLALEGGGDDLKFLYLDARKVFGHYLEYVWMTDATWDQLKAM
jgi:hypothetical protein